MKAELQELVALQNLDTTIRRLQKELEAIPERRAEVEKEFDQRAFEIKADAEVRIRFGKKRPRSEYDEGENEAKSIDLFHGEQLPQG